MWNPTPGSRYGILLCAAATVVWSVRTLWLWKRGRSWDPQGCGPCKTLHRWISQGILVVDSQKDLAVVFLNKGDGVLILPRREWTWNPTLSEVAFRCLVQVQTRTSVLVLVSVVFVLLGSVVVVLFLCFCSLL